MYEHRTTIPLSDTDAAGVLYFANLLRLAHGAYEAWFHQGGLPLATVIRNRPYSLPIVHADVDFKMPLRLGDEVVITCTVESLGEKSFTLAYSFRGPHGLAGSARTVHVAVDPTGGGSAIAVPAEVRQILSA